MRCSLPHLAAAARHLRHHRHLPLLPQHILPFNLERGLLETVFDLNIGPIRQNIVEDAVGVANGSVEVAGALRQPSRLIHLSLSRYLYIQQLLILLNSLSPLPSSDTPVLLPLTETDLIVIQNASAISQLVTVRHCISASQILLRSIYSFLGTLVGERAAAPGGLPGAARIQSEGTVLAAGFGVFVVRRGGIGRAPLGLRDLMEGLLLIFCEFAWAVL